MTSICTSVRQLVTAQVQFGLSTLPLGLTPLLPLCLAAHVSIHSTGIYICAHMLAINDCPLACRKFAIGVSLEECAHETAQSGRVTLRGLLCLKRVRHVEQGNPVKLSFQTHSQPYDIAQQGRFISED